MDNNKLSVRDFEYWWITKRKFLFEISLSRRSQVIEDR